MVKETCIVCGAETRDLCCCYTEKNTISILKDVVKDTPNDQQLGKKIREHYWQTHSGSYTDLETYRRGRNKY